ncbi:MAG: WecB/TagA/CpsF family glycosyltransferase [Anaerolineae bacterium]|nr:WecB/TagA/CpsF family glycosyltransferase [Anaerolineae bacterium]
MSAEAFTPPIHRILAVKIADIGDLILTTPALRAVRQTFPHARLDILTTTHSAAILNGTGLVDGVVEYRVRQFERARDMLRLSTLQENLRLMARLRAGQYDTVLVFHQPATRFGSFKQRLIFLSTGAVRRCGLYNGRDRMLTHRAPYPGFGVKHQAEYWLDVAALIGARTDDTRLIVGVQEADRAWAHERLPDGPRYAALYPGSGALNPARRWDPAKFAALADGLADSSLRVVLVGGPNDNAEAVLAHMQRRDALNLAGQTTLAQLGAVLERCELVIGNDGGVMHVAAASPGPQVRALFGPTNHRAWGPWAEPRDRALIVRSGVLCSPCNYIWDGPGLRQGCAAATCMKLIQPGDVPLLPGNGAAAAPCVETDGWRRGVKLPVRRRETPPTLHILGVPIDALTFAGLCDQVMAWVAERRAGHGQPRMIGTANPELVMIAQQDVLFFTILRRADLVTADGVGLLWAARRLGRPLPERVTGSDGLGILCERAARDGWRVYLLGAAPGVAERAAVVLAARYPGLQVAGTYSGSPSADEEDDLVARVNAARPDILFLAYGSPAQEKWIARNLPRLDVAVALGVGGAFDFAAGVAQRAPVWMRKMGVEWLHRLISQPWRWRRMLRLPRFVLAVLRRGENGPPRFTGPLDVREEA